MGEQEPLPRKFEFTFGELRIECDPTNSTVYLHSDEEDKKYDHIFVELQADPDEDSDYYYIFRRNLSNFDQVVSIMQVSSYTFVQPETVAGIDRENYNRLFGDEETVAPIEPPIHELTPRQERLVSFLANLLEHDYLTPADFEGTGDMFI